jgi:hypothetical protein
MTATSRFHNRHIVDPARTGLIPTSKQTLPSAQYQPISNPLQFNSIYSDPEPLTSHRVRAHGGTVSLG